MMKKAVLLMITFFGAVICKTATAQSTAPNDANAVSLSGNATGADKFVSTDVNIYTGIPSISVPVYKYNGPNDLSMNISLDYFAGGVKLNETATTVGIGWNLDAGGVITRTVRGMPDDYPVKGFLYDAALPADYRPNGTAYYHDSLDAEQDVFQFSFEGRSGKFFIGKNNQIVTVPLSKLRISYTTASSKITSFNIITEEGVKYVFNVTETGYNTSTGNVFKCGYDNYNYTSAWYLSQVIAPFGTDTIKYNYQWVRENNSIAYPQTAYVPVTAGTTILSKPMGTQVDSVKKLSSIILPDKRTISFVYDYFYKYDGTDYFLDRIKVSDTTFRYGYILKRDGVDGSILSKGYAFLTGIQYYTPSRLKTIYTFDYNTLPYMPLRYAADTFSNKRDHWGYYNAANNGLNAIPTVAGIYTGADRNPSATYAKVYSLNAITYE